jgi:hypothetical protein
MTRAHEDTRDPGPGIARRTPPARQETTRASGAGAARPAGRVSRPAPPGHVIARRPSSGTAPPTVRVLRPTPRDHVIARRPGAAPPIVRVAPSVPRGQASVELVALLPVVAIVLLAIVTVLASHVAHEQAGEAAEAGALAVLQGGSDPKQAAEQALSREARKRATISVTDGRVQVRVRPRVVLPIPGLAERLAGEARAKARP